MPPLGRVRRSKRTQWRKFGVAWYCQRVANILENAVPAKFAELHSLLKKSALS